MSVGRAYSTSNLSARIANALFQFGCLSRKCTRKWPAEKLPGMFDYFPRYICALQGRFRWKKTWMKPLAAGTANAGTALRDCCAGEGDEGVALASISWHLFSRTTRHSPIPKAASQFPGDCIGRQPPSSSNAHQRTTVDPEKTQDSCEKGR